MVCPRNNSINVPHHPRLCGNVNGEVREKENGKHHEQMFAIIL